jgi:hypothetical protein
MTNPNRLQSVAAPKVANAKETAPHVDVDLLGLQVLGDLPIFQRISESRWKITLSECGRCRSAQRRVAEVISVSRTRPRGAKG